jgi:hypothetical protein
MNPILQSLLVAMRRTLLFSMVLMFGWLATSCGNPGVEASNPSPSVAAVAVQQNKVGDRLSDGRYPVQQATYDDGSGQYRLVLLNTKPGQPSMLEIANLPMAQLTDEETASGQGNYLKVEGGEPALHISKDFKIEYVHNVTETAENPQTGQPQTVVVRQESSFWTPFAGALAGQALGSLLFTPHYYMPPIYQPGIVLVGHGGYGRTYDRAVSNYRDRYKAAPAEVRNRQTFRTTGRLRNPATAAPKRRVQSPGTRSTGSGFGSNTLRRSSGSRSGSQINKSRPNSGCGSGGRMRSPSRSFGGGMRSGGRRR